MNEISSILSNTPLIPPLPPDPPPNSSSTSPISTQVVQIGANFVPVEASPCQPLSNGAPQIGSVAQPTPAIGDNLTAATQEVSDAASDGLTSSASASSVATIQEPFPDLVFNRENPAIQQPPSSVIPNCQLQEDGGSAIPITGIDKFQTSKPKESSPKKSVKSSRGRGEKMSSGDPDLDAARAAAVAHDAALQQEFDKAKARVGKWRGCPL
ncbi:uncharacterized protein LOC118489746 isoform X2 [Helianthus annuus]|uniref:uncharacterized protein LOC118489746 isoform X2 n=1 Tax=Helianthus annuus TaxID=4232 RepID=UPI00165309F7|nr:uncharacterized protein LOC118489746 isoform X2 [Helianthus annuus]